MFLRKRAETVNTTASNAPPPPRIVQPSGDYDGNDGKWSTFYVNVGDKDNDGGGQNFKVLPSTWFGVTIAPYQAEWCDIDCAKDRGVGTVNGNQVPGLVTSPDSSTWNEAGNYDLTMPYWYFNKTDTPAAYYGLDYLGIGQASKDSYVVPKMLIAGTKSEDFYLGQFGLAPGATNLGGGKGSIDSILSTFNNTGTIPSISYGYAAGASYKNSGNGIPGSLVLGGYDETRIDRSKGVSISMPSIQNNSLVVGVQSIIYKPNANVEANTFSFTEDNVKGFKASIDSTFPYLWLPDAVCDHFAERFNLKYDNKTNFYTLNSTSAQQNTQQNATVSFRIGSDPLGSGSDYATITLPYSAFDLTYFDPLNQGNTIKYFPIKKSPNGMFVLGRTFLQEAYIVVDYKRTNFTVAQALHPNPLPDPKPVTIYDPSYVAPTPTLIPTNGGNKGLSGGAIAGIVVGILVVALGAAFGIFIWWKKRRERKNALPNYKEATGIDTSAAGNEVKGRRVSELDSQPPGLPKPAAVGGFYGDNRDRKDLSPFPPISEMDSPPAELYSPPAVTSTPHSEGNGTDYFTAGGKLGRRGATRESSANTPGTPPPITPVAELPGDDGGYQVGGQHFDPISSSKGSPTLKSESVHKRDPSATRSQSNIDEVMKRHSAEPSPAPPAKDESATGGTTSEDKQPETSTEGEPLERRPSHTRGLSDTTVQSDTTVVSQPTPEELERWALAEDEQPRRPLSE